MTVPAFDLFSRDVIWNQKHLWRDFEDESQHVRSWLARCLLFYSSIIGIHWYSWLFSRPPTAFLFEICSDFGRVSAFGIGLHSTSRSKLQFSSRGKESGMCPTFLGERVGFGANIFEAYQLIIGQILIRIWPKIRCSWCRFFKDMLSSLTQDTYQHLLHTMHNIA